MAEGLRQIRKRRHRYENACSSARLSPEPPQNVALAQALLTDERGHIRSPGASPGTSALEGAASALVQRHDVDEIDSAVAFLHDMRSERIGYLSGRGIGYRHGIG